MKEPLAFVSFPVRYMGCRTISAAAEDKPMGPVLQQGVKGELVLAGEEEPTAPDIWVCLTITVRPWCFPVEYK